MAKRLQDKVVLVTGAGSSGPGWSNGKAIAALCAREGARVFGCDIRLGAAQETCGLVRAEGGEMEVSRCDVSRSSDVQALIAGCVETFGRLDVLVNNVGVVEVGGPVDYPEDKWQRALEVNVTSMFLTCKHAIPHMERQGGGSIVNIGSIAGIRYTGVSYIAYCTSKSAALGLSRSVALEYAKQKIRCNVVLPGLMNTPMIVEPLKQAYGDGDVQRMMRRRDEQCPMGHMGDAWDVAHAVLWLASDDAKYVTAAEIVVDGGMTARCA
jgi:NAD(P)-dependent dehydrogenase (short-subunit alcohol dehydrogenase family)